MQERFARFAATSSRVMGAPITFVGVLALMVAWAVAGPFFRFSDTWQLLANTSTTLLTTLLVLLVQNSQVRSERAIQLKLDTIVVALQAASNTVVAAETLTDAELALRQAEILKLAGES